MVLGIVFAILTGLSWVLVGAVVGLAEKRRCGTERQQLVTSLLAVAIAGLAYAAGPFLLPGSDIFRFGGDLRGAGAMALCGFLNFWMILAMGRAMARGPNGPVWTITQSGFVFPFALGVISGNTRFSWTLATGLALVIANTAVTGLCGKKDEGGSADAGSPPGVRGRHFPGWLPLALLAFFFCGMNQCAALLVAYLPVEARPKDLERFLWLYGGIFIGWLFHAAWRRLWDGPPQRDPALRAKYAYLMKICGISTVIAFAVCLFFNFKAIDLLTDANAGAIAYPLMVVSCFLGFAVYGRAVLRERLTPLQRVAFAAGIAGIILLSSAGH